MKYKILFLSFFLYSAGISQDVSITNHKSNRLGKGLSYFLDFRKNDNFFVVKKEVTKVPGGTYYLEERDAGFNLIQTHDLLKLLQNSKHMIKDFLFIKDKLVVFLKLEDSKMETVTYYHQSVDTETMKVSKKRTLCTLTLDKKIGHTLKSKASDNEEFFSIAVTSTTKTGLQEIKERTISFYLMNSELEKIWIEKDLIYENDELKYIDYIPGNLGELYALQRDKVSKEINLQVFSNDGNESIRNVFAGKDVFNSKLRISPNDDLVAFGSFREKGNYNKTGVFLYAYSASSFEEIQDFSTIFPDKLTLYGLSKSDKVKLKKNRTYLLPFRLDGAEFDQFGNIYLVGSEFMHTVDTYTSSSGATRNLNRYTYGSIYISKFDKNGDFVFNSKIPRSQTTNRIDKSYVYYLNEEGLNFFFCDPISNINKNFTIEAFEEVKSSPETSGLTRVHINNTGMVLRKNLFELNFDNYKYYSFSNITRSGNSIVVYSGTGKRKNTLTLLNFEN